ncbi:MAG: DUF1643 domain-containing protein [Eubacteriales bacterium]
MSWIYEKNHDNSARYILGTKGKNPLVCFGINPSTATPKKLDNTLKSVSRIAINNNYDSWIMFNVYPQRATNPNKLHDSIDLSLHKMNIIHVKKILEEYKPTLWAAWGTLIKKRIYLYKCLYDIFELSCMYQCNWITFGKTSKLGHPHHPLYLKKDSNPVVFPIEEYMATKMEQQYNL